MGQCLRAVCVSIVLAAPAAASELSWDGPAECDRAEQLTWQIEAALGMPLARAGQLEFEVRVEQAGSSASARLSVESPEPGTEVKQRVLVAASCAKLVDTLAVAISLILGEPAQPASATAGTSGAPPEPVPVRGDVSSDALALPGEAQSAGALEASALAFVVGDVGSLPATAWGAALGIELAWSRVQLRALGTFFFEQQARVAASSSEAGGELNLAYATLLACAEPVSALALHTSLCAGLDVGRMSGVGTGVVQAWGRAVPWLAPRLDAGFSWRIPETQLRLCGFLGAAVPLNRDVFLLDAIGTVHRPRSVAGHAGLGMGLTFE